MAIIGCMTLGLAPFHPEPHLIGKLRWICGGAQGMNHMDYFDLIMHGTPWAYLLYIIGIFLLKKKRNSTI